MQPEYSDKQFVQQLGLTSAEEDAFLMAGTASPEPVQTTCEMIREQLHEVKWVDVR